MRLRAVFFDLDGTLFDTAEDLGAALNHVLQLNGMPAMSQSRIRHVVSDGAAGLIKLGFNFGPEHSRYAIIRQQLLDFYLQNTSQYTQLFPGIYELLKKLKENRICWGIATNKPWSYTDALMRAFTFPEEPVCVICPDHVTYSKPSPDSLLLACEKAQCAPCEALYIGDHIRDIECGNNAEMRTISAGYGYIKQGDDHTCWPADYCIAHPNDIWPIIQQHIL